MFLIIVTNLSLGTRASDGIPDQGREELIVRKRPSFIQAGAQYVVATDFTVCKSDELTTAVPEKPNV